MKSSLLFLLSILFTHLSFAQNYACIQRNHQRYFINEDGYLRGIQIDTFEVSGSDTVLYPFRTYRYITPGSGRDVSNGSWIGGRITQQTDGTFIFPTLWLRNVIIKTAALPGDTWTFYTDASPRSYQATLTAMDTMTIFGTLDSIKRIQITAYYGTAINSTDPVDGYEMILSKEHGFVKTFDLYLFPYRWVSGELVNDFYQDMVGSIGKRKMTFELTDFHVPTEMEVFDFNVGDVFVTKGYTYNEMPERNWLTYDSIVSKSYPDSWHVQYRIFQKENSTTAYYPWGGPSIVHKYFDTGTFTIQFDTSKLFSMPYMPEATPTRNKIWYYRPNDSSNCFKSAYYSMEDVVVFEGGPNHFEYKTGFEQIAFSSHTPPNSSIGEIGYHSTREAELIFSVKNGLPCGSRAEPNSVTELNEINKQLSIYPNPVSDELNISVTMPIRDVSITDMTGRVLYSNAVLPAQCKIDVSQYAPGVYILKMDGAVRKFVKQ